MTRAALNTRPVLASSAEKEEEARLAAKSGSAGSGGGTALIGVLATVAAALGVAPRVKEWAMVPPACPVCSSRFECRLGVAPHACSWVSTQASGGGVGLTGPAGKTAPAAAPFTKAPARSKSAAQKAAAEAAALEAAAAEVASAKAAAERAAFLKSSAGRKEARAQVNAAAAAAAAAAQEKAVATAARAEKAAAAKEKMEAKRALQAPKDTAGKAAKGEGGGGGGAILGGVAVVGGGGLALATAARARWASTSKRSCCWVRVRPLQQNRVPEASPPTRGHALWAAMVPARGRAT